MEPRSPLEKPRITVLHLDNDGSQLKLTKQLLESAEPRLHIITASTHEELIQQLSSPHDCVLSDIHLQGIDGSELCDLLKKGDDTPFILYTSELGEEVAKKALSLGADDSITKALNPRHFRFLAKRITQIVEKHRSVSSPFTSNHLEALFLDTADMARATSLEEAAECLFNAIRRLGPTCAGLHLLQDGKLSQKYTIGPALHESPSSKLESYDTVVKAAEKGKTLVVSKKLDGTCEEADAPKRIVSEAAVPFKVNGVVAGVISVESDIANAFSKGDVQLLEMLAPHVASAVSRLTQSNQPLMTEEEWRSILGSSMDAAIIVQENRIVYANRRCAELLGYSDLGDLVGLDQLNVVASSDHEKVYQWTSQRRLGANQLSYFELVLCRRDCSEVVVEVNHASIVYRGAEAALWFCKDLTERLHYQRKLSALHICAVNLGKALNEGEIHELIMDAVKTVLGFDFAGIAIREGEGLRYKKIIGVPLVDDWLIPVDGRSITARAYRTGARQIIPDTRLEADYLSPRGEQGICEALSELAVPIYEDDSIIGVINVESADPDAFDDHDADLIETLAAHAVSSLRRIKEKQSLEDKVKEQTDKLLETERFSAHGQIAAMVAHDLRSPLQTIRNSAYMFQIQYGQSKEIARIEDTVSFVAKILEELTNDTVGTPLCPMTCNLVDIIKSTIDAVSKPPGTRIEFAHDDIGTVVVDPVKIRRMMNNLVTNSLDAMSDGGAVIVKLTHNESELCIEVTDTGPGIPCDLMPRLFKEVITTKLTGHGLGLPYCGRVAALHGGRIYVDPDHIGGARVVVELPLSRESGGEQSGLLDMKPTSSCPI